MKTLRRFLMGLITQAADNHARTAVALQCGAVGSTGVQNAACSLANGRTSAIFAIPPGQRLVIAPGDTVHSGPVLRRYMRVRGGGDVVTQWMQPILRFVD